MYNSKQKNVRSAIGRQIFLYKVGKAISQVLFKFHYVITIMVYFHGRGSGRGTVSWQRKMQMFILLVSLLNFALFYG